MNMRPATGKNLISRDATESDVTKIKSGRFSQARRSQCRHLAAITSEYGDGDSSAAAFPTEVVIYKLNDNDVLSGRDPNCVNYIGNRDFRDLVQTKLVEYRSSKQHHVKDRVAVGVMDHVRAKGGRFLRKIESMAESRELGVSPVGADAWTYADVEIATNKCKQTFRDYISKSKNAVSSTTIRRRSGNPIVPITCSSQTATKRKGTFEAAESISGIRRLRRMPEQQSHNITAFENDRTTWERKIVGQALQEYQRQFDLIRKSSTTLLHHDTNTTSLVNAAVMGMSGYADVKLQKQQQHSSFLKMSHVNRTASPAASTSSSPTHSLDRGLR